MKFSAQDIAARRIQLAFRDSRRDLLVCPLMFGDLWTILSPCMIHWAGRTVESWRFMPRTA